MYQIPTHLEKLVLTGKATYKTKQLGIAEQYTVEVPDDKFIVIYGFRYVPFNPGFNTNFATRDSQNDIHIVNFKTSDNFFPFIFKPETNYIPSGANLLNIGITPEFQKSCYIIANNTLGIYVTRGTQLLRPDQQNQIGPLPPQYENAFDATLGYGNTVAIQYNEGFAGAPLGIPFIFNPLPGFRSPSFFINLNPLSQVFDQLFTIPNLNSQLNVSGYNMGTDVNAYAKHHYLQIDYVEINSTKPEFLQL